MQVEAGVLEFFVPAAERLLASGNPSRLLAAALASMSGFRKVPSPRSLLTSERGYVTLRLMTEQQGVVDGYRCVRGIAGRGVCVHDKCGRLVLGWWRHGC